MVKTVKSSVIKEDVVNTQSDPDPRKLSYRQEWVDFFYQCISIDICYMWIAAFQSVERGVHMDHLCGDSHTGKAAS